MAGSARRLAYLCDEYGHCGSELLAEFAVADPVPLDDAAPAATPPFHIGRGFDEVPLPDEVALGWLFPLGHAPLYGRDPPAWFG